MGNKLKSIVGIPAYNEEKSIGSVVLKTKKYVDQVVVVDDGSSDSTAEIAELAGATVVKHNKNRGYGSAIKTCFEVANNIEADILVILDADGQHNPNEIPTLIKTLIEGGYDIVAGSRFLIKKNSNVPLYRKIGARILNFFTKISYKKKISISDSQSGFRAYSKRAISDLNISLEGMGAGSEILIHAAKVGLKYAEVPITCSYDVRKPPRNPISHGAEVLFSVFKIIGYERPIFFFGVPGLFLIILGIFYGMWTIQLYLSKKNLPVGNALLTLLFSLMGVFSIFTAIILFILSDLTKSNKKILESLQKDIKEIKKVRE